MLDETIGTITDFFDLCAYAAERKCRLLRESPHIMDFIVRAFCAGRGAVPDVIYDRFRAESEGVFGKYFRSVDFTKFRDDVDPAEIYQMLAWMTEGCVYERQRAGKAIELGEIMAQYACWSAYFRRMAYKEEFWEQSAP